jgi:hypothetical protein
MRSYAKNTSGAVWGGNHPVGPGAEPRLGSAAAERIALQPECEFAPVWLAALAAVTRRATRDGEACAVGWKCDCGRALYTNAGADAELIQPLGVNLAGGQTLAVYWMPGETNYTLEVYGAN